MDKKQIIEETFIFKSNEQQIRDFQKDQRQQISQIIKLSQNGIKIDISKILYKQDKFGWLGQFINDFLREVETKFGKGQVSNIFKGNQLVIGNSDIIKLFIDQLKQLFNVYEPFYIIDTETNKRYIDNLSFRMDQNSVSLIKSTVLIDQSVNTINTLIETLVITPIS